MFYHERLQCYIRLKAIAQTLLTASRQWPRGQYYLVDQLKRAVSSGILNLVEGNQRNSPKERRRFFNISKASVGEVAAILDIAALLGLVDQASTVTIKSELLSIAKMIASLPKSWS